VKRWIAVLTGVVVVEAALLIFVLSAFSQRIDRIETSVRVTASEHSAHTNHRDTALAVHF
jgi:hypothetical protein